MKKLLLPFFLLLTGVVIAHAQGIAIGARAGLNIANESVTNNQSPGSSYSARTSFLLGGYAKFMVTDKVGIQPELFYSSTGSKVSSSSVSGTITSNYLCLPVFFRYNVSDNFHLLLGPQLGILLAAKATVGGVSVDAKDFFNSSDFAAVIGAGVDFGPVNAGLRYNFGLSNIEKDSSGGETVKNNVFQIVAGYKLFGK